jgi:hypothetical protein
MNKVAPLLLLLGAGFGIAWVSNTNAKSKKPLFANPIFTYKGDYLGSFENAKKLAPGILDAWQKCGNTASAPCDKAREQYRELVIKYPSLAKNPAASNPCVTLPDGTKRCTGGR